MQFDAPVVVNASKSGTSGTPGDTKESQLPTIMCVRVQGGAVAVTFRMEHGAVTRSCPNRTHRRLLVASTSSALLPSCSELTSQSTLSSHFHSLPHATPSSSHRATTGTSPLFEVDEKLVKSISEMNLNLVYFEKGKN